MKTSTLMILHFVFYFVLIQRPTVKEITNFTFKIVENICIYFFTLPVIATAVADFKLI